MEENKKIGILKKIIGSMKKSKKLQKLSITLGKATLEDILNFESYMNKNNEALEELVDLCESDLNNRVILNNYKIDREQLKEIFRILNNPETYNGENGDWVAGHHVPSSTIVYYGTLDFAFKNKEKLFNGTSEEKAYICERLYKYFKNGEVGFIKN
jgi:hypothetical protein